MDNSSKDLEIIPVKTAQVGRGGIHLSRCQFACLLMLFAVTVITVGLMAGLLRRPCPQCLGSDDHVENHVQDRSVLEQPWLDVFLPDYIVPVHYDLYQDPDFYHDGSVFYGEETIEISLQSDSKYLLVHIKDMNVTKTNVRGTDGLLPINRTFAYDPNQYWVVELVDIIPGGSTVFLYLEFTGSLVNGIVGYYKSTYVNSNTGTESWLATTKFQPSDARKAFPNFDEPRFKAEFTISLRHWQNFTALSNMPVSTAVDLPDGWRQTTFQRTPPMSSYLVVFIVCDFIYKETFMNSSKSVKIWAQPDKINQADYALGITKTVMDHLQLEFDIPYHLPKLDSLAVPDYPSGATEHWGLVTYRIGRLLYDASQVSEYDKQRVAMIVAHEMAHNYFGNPVTCHWWDDLWLNEGFAVFYEAKETQNAEPEFNAVNQMVVNDIQGIMQTDGSNSSRPLLIDINSPNEANAAFDGITYDKGAAMLRMMEGFLGEETFRSGVRFLLNKFEYQSIVTQDLWNSMQQAVSSGLNVTEIMMPWVYQPGLPIVNVSIDGTNIRATQHRFMKDPDADVTLPESPYGYKWYVPLTYITQSGVSGLVWMNGTDSVVFPDPTNGSEWIKFNNGQYMYYRVNYSDHLFRRLLLQINDNFTDFEPIDRANLLDDAFNVARAGQAHYAGVLNMTTYLTAEVDWEPWKAARTGLTYISDMLYTSADYSLFRSYIQDITGFRMDKLKVQDSGTHMEKLNRQDIISLSCGHGYSQCIQNTTRYFAYWLQNDTVFPVPLNIRRVVYSFGMQAIGGDDEFAIMWDRYAKATSTQEADNILYGLTWTDKLWLIQRLLDYSMDETKIRSQDFFTLMDYIGQNKVANGYLWDWVRANYDYIVDRFGLDNRDLGRLVPKIVSGYNTQFQLDEVRSFYAQYPDAGTGEQARADSLDSIQNNIKWMSRSEEPIIDWLRNYE